MMKTTPTTCRWQHSRTRLKLFPAVAAAGLLLLGPGIAATFAGPILLDAPQGSGAYYGMYGPNVLAASFTLAASYDVTTIDVKIRTAPSSTFNTFDFSLQDAVNNPVNVFASKDLTISANSTSTAVMNVNTILPAGTYYLTSIIPGYFGTTITPGNVNGWLQSSGAYTQTAGTIANGVWVGNTPPTFNTGGPYVAPAFTVNGSAVPEPSMWAMLAAGIGAFLSLRHSRKQLVK